MKTKRLKAFETKLFSTSEAVEIHKMISSVYFVEHVEGKKNMKATNSPLRLKAGKHRAQEPNNSQYEC
jgi:hypothetical protein